MNIIDNKKHFLHKHLTFLESAGIDGQKGGFTKFLSDLRVDVDVSGDTWSKFHSTINWPNIKNRYQFFFDYVGNENEIKAWLRDSDLSKHEFLYTWLSWEDPIIKVKTTDFIENWEEFNIARAWEGIVLITVDGQLYLEFTDAWGQLHSNFQIKPDSKV